MTFYGYDTKILNEPLSLAEAATRYPRWYAVILDPERHNATLISGQVRAVSKTHDGAFRALYSLGPVARKVTVERLKRR